MSQSTISLFGRIRLTQVIESWAQEHPLNTRMLAVEFAGTLRSIGKEAQPLGHHIVVITPFDLEKGSIPIGLGHLIAFFEHYSTTGLIADIDTGSGAIPAATILLSKAWLDALVREVEVRAEIAAGLTQAQPVVVRVGVAELAVSLEAQLSGSSSECLALRQEQQRQAGEQTSSERLEQSEQAAHHSNAELTQLTAEYLALERRFALEQENHQHWRRQAQEAQRARTLIEDKLRDHAGIIEFMDANNPLSPVEGRRLVAAWAELTENGTVDPTRQKGRGIGELIRTWWQDRHGIVTDSFIKRAQWVIAWSGRKQGGAVRKETIKKG